MINKKKNILNLVLFLGIFAILMLIATFFDLQISQILTKGGLEAGSYYTNNLMGAIIEIIGSFPIFGALFYATLIMAKSFYNRKGFIKFVSIIFIIGSIVDVTWFLKDTFKYTSRIYGFEHIYELDYMMLIYVGLAIIISLISHYSYKKVDLNKNEELKTLAFTIFAACAFHLSIELIKGPVGRMRFRAMNVIDDFSYFTPWYLISSAKEIVTSDLIPSDSFKSFPSGHTFSAGMIYLINCLPYCFEKFNNKKSKIILLVISIAYTGLVAFYRIRVGAHFMSDVVFGGSLAFFVTFLFRYIFLVRKKVN